LKTYYPTINLLRAVAAIMVCLSHFTGYIDNPRGSLFPTDGWLYSFSKLGLNGVYIFFIVSGFVIPLSLAKENFNVAKLPRFLSRRFIRIELPFIASIFIIMLIRLIYSFKNHTPFELQAEQIFYHLVYYIPFTNLSWLDGVYWTLAIEFQFYIVMGLLFTLFSSKNKIVMWITFIIFSGLNFLVKDDRFIFHYAIIFAQGILLFLMKTQKVNNTAGLFSLVGCILATGYLHSVEIAIFCAITLLFIHFLEVNNRVTNRLGDISYSLYLTHVTIGGNMLYLFYKYFNGTIERLVLVSIVFMSALIFAYAFWWIIENPAKKLSKRIRV
jgi:peptidoglycan/LPS O-acetylase OafA/YrhL